jgi:hypothetical protein
MRGLCQELSRGHLFFQGERLLFADLRLRRLRLFLLIVLAFSDKRIIILNISRFGY